VRRHAIALSVCAAAGVASTAAAGADDYPNRPIRMLVPVSVGSSADTAARAFAHKLSETLGKPIVVENKVGAGGRIGAAEAARAAPDGYTLFYGTSITQALYPALGHNVSYDPLKDFEALGQTFWFATAVVCNAQAPFTDFRGLVAYAKANPGKLTFANSGNGGGNHFSTELLATMAGIQIHHVPFRGNAPGIQAVLDRVVDCTLQTEVKPFVDAGQLRPLATTGKQRDPRFPNVPTVEELGVSGYVSTWWHAVYAPAGTPPAVRRKLEDAVKQVAQDPGVAARTADIGLLPEYLPPAEVTQRTQADIATFKRIAAQSRIELE
jgi:tripartite-type tricarboxylate transporter receptor subunit TctC